MKRNPTPVDIHSKTVMNVGGGLVGRTEKRVNMGSFESKQRLSYARKCKVITLQARCGPEGG